MLKNIALFLNMHQTFRIQQTKAAQTIFLKLSHKQIRILSFCLCRRPLLRDALCMRRALAVRRVSDVLCVPALCNRAWSCSYERRQRRQMSVSPWLRARGDCHHAHSSRRGLYIAARLPASSCCFSSFSHCTELCKFQALCLSAFVPSFCSAPLRLCSFLCSSFCAAFLCALLLLVSPPLYTRLSRLCSSRLRSASSQPFIRRARLLHLRTFILLCKIKRQSCNNTN